MAKLAFDHLAGAYARFRPTYPETVLDAVVERVGPHAGKPVLDLGTGPGTLADALARRGWPVIALDASLSMLSASSGPSPRVNAVAERLPVRDAACTLVTAAQAVHWFNPRWALLESGRVLHPGGLIALVTYRRSRQSAFNQALEAWIGSWNPRYRGEMATQDWPAKLAATGLFRDPETNTLDWDWWVSPDDFAGYLGTLTYLQATVPARDRPRMIEDLRRWLPNWQRGSYLQVPMKVRIDSAVRC